MSGQPNSSKTHPHPRKIFGLKNHGAFCRLRETDEAVIFRLVVAVFEKQIQFSSNIISVGTGLVTKEEFASTDPAVIAQRVSKLKSLLHETKFDYLEYQEPEGQKEEIYAKIAAWMKEF